MAQQLLWIEACLKLVGGLALVTAPRGLARLLGLPSADDRFWPRLLGGVLIGLAAASLIEGRNPGAGGLGLAGSIAVNLAGAAVIGALLILHRAGNTKRGRLLLCLVVALLVLLSLVEIAHADLFRAIRASVGSEQQASVSSMTTQRPVDLDRIRPWRRACWSSRACGC